MTRIALLTVGGWLAIAAASFGQGSFPTPWPAPVTVDAMWPAPSGCGVSPVVVGDEPTGGIGCPDCGECFTPAWDPGITYWADADFLAWWTRGLNLPPLVTASPGVMDKDRAGAIGRGNTTILAGGTDVDDDARLGGRVVLGFWLGPQQRFGLFAEFFGLENDNSSFLATTTETTEDNYLARPFFNIDSGNNEGYLVAVPGSQEGSIGVRTYSRLYGAGILGRQFICGGNNWRLDLVGGYRYLYLGEQLLVNSDAVLTRDIEIEIPGPDRIIPAGTHTKISDRFRTRSQFHGEDLGFRYDWRSGRFTADMTARIGLGFNFNRVDIHGRTVFAEPGREPQVVRGGGLLALKTNSGGYKDTQFTVVPAVTFNFGYDITNNWRLRFGYDFLWWGEVSRPGEQIDLRLNPTIIPPNSNRAGPAAPIFQFHDTSFWAQGLHGGIEFRY